MKKQNKNPFRFERTILIRLSRHKGQLQMIGVQLSEL